MGVFSFFHKASGDLRSPEAIVLPDGRKRLTRFLSVGHSFDTAANLALPKGTVDDSGTAPTGWEGLRLVDCSQRDDLPAPGRDSRPMVVLVYEQLHATAETQVGKVQIKKLEDGRTALVYEFLQFSTTTATPGRAGTSTAPDDPTAFLMHEDAPNDGTLRRITRTYVRAGLISESTFRRGTLLGKTVVWVKTEPETPLGYVLEASKRVDNPNGLPTYTYTYIATTDAEYSTQRYVDFLMPGRAKAFYMNYGWFRLIELFRSPPAQIKVLATITISFQTEATLSEPSDLWNPKEWAVMRAQWVGFGGNPHSQVESLQGYRAEGSAVELTSSNVAPSDTSILGNGVFGASTARLEVTGGPDNPAGNTYTLDVALDETPAFIAASGTKYYRKTTVVATIPTMSELPV